MVKYGNIFYIKKIATAFFAIVFFALSMSISMPITVLASTIIDRNKLGSIIINTCRDNSDVTSALSGTKFTIYKIANLLNSGDFELTKDFLGSGVLLDKLSTAKEISSASKILASYVEKKKISGRSNITDINGTVEFKDLTLGYYLVLQTVISPDNCMECDPILIALPMNCSDNKNWIYDIIAYPKSESVRGAVILEKVNSSAALLSGAVFRLEKKVYIPDGVTEPQGVKISVDSNGKYYWNTLISALVTNNYGQIVLKNLLYGQYRFIETVAPGGYILDMTPHEFSITVSGTVALVSGKYVKASGTVQTITVLNLYSNAYYYPTSIPYPTPITYITSTPSPTPLTKSTPATRPPEPAITKTPENIGIKDKDKPHDINASDKTKNSKGKQTGNVTPADFNLPKTGGSICYAVCTYGGTTFIISGVIVFVISRKKKS